MNEQELTLWAIGLLSDLDALATLWATYGARRADDDIPPQIPFTAGLEVCAEQLREAVVRARKLACDDWNFSLAAMQAEREH